MSKYKKALTLLTLLIFDSCMLLPTLLGKRCRAAQPRVFRRSASRIDTRLLAQQQKRLQQASMSAARKESKKRAASTSLVVRGMFTHKMLYFLMMFSMYTLWFKANKLKSGFYQGLRSIMKAFGLLNSSSASGRDLSQAPDFLDADVDSHAASQPPASQPAASQPAASHVISPRSHQARVCLDQTTQDYREFEASLARIDGQSQRARPQRPKRGQRLKRGRKKKIIPKKKRQCFLPRAAMHRAALQRLHESDSASRDVGRSRLGTGQQGFIESQRSTASSKDSGWINPHRRRRSERIQDAEEAAFFPVAHAEESVRDHSVLPTASTTPEAGHLETAFGGQRVVFSSAVAPAPWAGRSRVGSEVVGSSAVSGRYQPVAESDSSQEDPSLAIQEEEEDLSVESAKPATQAQGALSLWGQGLLAIPRRVGGMILKTLIEANRPAEITQEDREAGQALREWYAADLSKQPILIRLLLEAERPHIDKQESCEIEDEGQALRRAISGGQDDELTRVLSGDRSVDLEGSQEQLADQLSPKRSVRLMCSCGPIRFIITLQKSMLKRCFNLFSQARSAGVLEAPAASQMVPFKRAAGILKRYLPQSVIQTFSPVVNRIRERFVPRVSLRQEEGLSAAVMLPAQESFSLERPAADRLAGVASAPFPPQASLSRSAGILEAPTAFQGAPFKRAAGILKRYLPQSVMQMFSPVVNRIRQRFFPRVPSRQERGLPAAVMLQAQERLSLESPAVARFAGVASAPFPPQVLPYSLAGRSLPSVPPRSAAVAKEAVTAKHSEELAAAPQIQHEGVERKRVLSVGRSLFQAAIVKPLGKARKYIATWFGFLKADGSDQYDDDAVIDQQEKPSKREAGEVAAFDHDLPGSPVKGVRGVDADKTDSEDTDDGVTDKNLEKLYRTLDVLRQQEFLRVRYQAYQAKKYLKKKRRGRQRCLESKVSRDRSRGADDSEEPSAALPKPASTAQAMLPTKKKRAPSIRKNILQKMISKIKAMVRTFKQSFDDAVIESDPSAGAMDSGLSVRRIPSALGERDFCSKVQSQSHCKIFARDWWDNLVETDVNETVYIPALDGRVTRIVADAYKETFERGVVLLKDMALFGPCLKRIARAMGIPAALDQRYSFLNPYLWKSILLPWKISDERAFVQRDENAPWILIEI